MLTPLTAATESSLTVTNWNIYTGAKNRMYTLWVERSQTGTQSAHGFYYEQYIRNLSMDLDEALKKAAEITGVDADRINVMDDGIEPMQRGEDVLRFGKYDNHHVLELTDEKYLNWLAKGGFLKSDRDEQWYPSLFGEKEKFKYLAQDRLIALGLWVTYRGKKVSAEKADKWKAKDEFMDKALRGHHYANGERIKGETLLFIQSTFFEAPSSYGYRGETVTVWIATFITPSGKLLKYKGGSHFWCDGSKLLGCAFTVEHGEYKGEQETRIKRVKIGYKESFGSDELDPSKI